jgi:transmembrane sensor
VEKGQIAARAGHSVNDTLAWRQRRLVFHDARLADVAAEFNRYNRTKIRVEGEAQEILLSGIFDADRPPALMLYAAGNPKLAVEPAGNDWVIRDR